jgi:peptide/nickel transport system substrate-binding protein
VSRRVWLERPESERQALMRFRKSGRLINQGRSRGRRTLALAAAAITTVLLAACTSSGGATGGATASTGGKLAAAGTATLTVVPPEGPADTWNPIEATGGYMFLGVYATLLVTNPGGKLTGYLASSWTDTPTTITFTIKKGVTCSDGTALTPTDVANSLTYYFASNDPEKTSSFGAGPYTVTADDATNTVTVKLGTPYADAIY